MGRVEARDLHENGTWARAWIAASEDPVAGIDQKGKVFFNTIHRRFSEKSPASVVGVEGRYGLHSPESVRKHINNLSADAQKFKKHLRTVRLCEPTGVSEDEMLSMAVAVHIEKCTAMSYEYKSSGHNNLVGFRA